MRRDRALALVFVLATLLSPACTLRPFLPNTPAEVTVAPNYLCSGEPADVVWDLDLPRHESFCEHPTGGYPEARACSDDSDCDDGRCVDGLCCASPLPTAECGTSCPPDSTATLAFAPPGATPTTTSPHERGRVTISPTQTTTITLTGEWGPPTTSKGPITTRVVVVDAPPLENLLMGFAFACAGSSWGWSDFDLGVAGVHPSRRVTVESVRNTTGRQIRVGDGVHALVTLDAGASTTALNGRLDGTLWSADLTSMGTFGLPIPRCTPLDESDPYPDLSIEVTLGCEPIEEP